MFCHSCMFSHLDVARAQSVAVCLTFELASPLCGGRASNCVAAPPAETLRHATTRVRLPLCYTCYTWSASASSARYNHGLRRRATKVGSRKTESHRRVRARAPSKLDYRDDAAWWRTDSGSWRPGKAARGMSSMIATRSSSCGENGERAMRAARQRARRA